MISALADNLRLCGGALAGLLILVGAVQRDEANEQPTPVTLVERFDVPGESGPRYLAVCPDSSAAEAESIVAEAAEPQESLVEGVEFRICRVTAYCDRGITAAGTESGVGQCAAPADIPFGTRVYIPELDRTFVVTDRTHKRFRGNTVDLFMPTEEICRQFGRNYLECEFQLPDEKWQRPRDPSDRSWADDYRDAIAMTDR
ncbi:MAG: 3D domain-containing protein [Phycisphaerae bacterium]